MSRAGFWCRTAERAPYHAAAATISREPRGACLACLLLGVLRACRGVASMNGTVQRVGLRGEASAYQQQTGWHLICRAPSRFALPAQRG